MNETERRQEDFDPGEEKLLEIFRAMERKSGSMSVMKTEKLKDMAQAVTLLKAYAEETGGKITYDINTPFTGMGYIRINGKKLRFRSAGAFTEAAKLASNVEAYAMADGSVSLDFTFHGITKKVK